MSIPQYSTLFSCLHNEQEQVGRIGRGTHYSIMRSAEWLDVTRKALALPEVHDFAVIWDEDHDARVISVVERLYMSGLLSPVQFIGERKGGLTVIVAARFYFQGSEEDTEQYRRQIQGICRSVEGDSWPVNLGSFDRHPDSPGQTFPGDIINDEEQKVTTYLRNIDNLWRLGTKPYAPLTIASNSIFHD